MRITRTLQRTHDTAPDGDWQSAVSTYLLEPAPFWGDAASRHVQRIEASKQALRRRDGLDDRDIVGEVVSMAAKRRRQRPAPVYVTGLDPSGSRRVADMLAGLPGLVAVGAIDVPQRLLDELAALSSADQACAVDALALLHGWPRTAHVWAAHLVCESAVHRLRQHSRRDPGTVGVHVARDPREQALASMLADGDDRHRHDGVSDDERLRRTAARVAASFEQSRAVVDLIDVRCRFEDLMTDPRPLLRGVLQELQRPIDEAAVDRAATTSALAGNAGNGVTAIDVEPHDAVRRWRTAVDPARERVLHMYLADAIHGLGYPPGDCMGTPVPDHTLGTRTLRGAATAPGPLYQRVDGNWVRVDPRTPTIDAGVPVMLRMADGSDLSALHAWAGDDLQALCLTGNASARDRALRPLAGLAGLRVLDLARTPVTDAGLEHVAGMTGLQQLHLASTATTAQGRATLARTLPQLTIWT